MAQDLFYQQQDKPRKLFTGKNESVTVGSGDVDLLEVSTLGMERMFARLKNTHGSVAFDAVKVLAKCTEDTDDDWVDVSAVSGIVTLSGSIATLAAGSVGYIIVDCRGLSKVKIQASTGSSGSASIYASGS